MPRTSERTYRIICTGEIITYAEDRDSAMFKAKRAARRYDAEVQIEAYRVVTKFDKEGRVIWEER